MSVRTVARPFEGVPSTDETQELLCSHPGCTVRNWDQGFPLIDITVLCSPGEEGYAEVTQLFCDEHYEEMAAALAALGFVSHNHHGTNLLDGDADWVDHRCGGYGKCPHEVEYGPELVVADPPDKPDRLWGEADDEVLYTSIVEWIKHVGVNNYDPDIATRQGPWKIVEYTVLDHAEHLPTPGEVADYVVEAADEITDVVDFAPRTPGQVALAVALVDTVAAGMSGWMADKPVGHREVRYIDGDWFIDGSIVRIEEEGDDG